MTLLITFKNGQQDLLAGVQVDISKALDIAYRGNDLLHDFQNLFQLIHLITD